MNIEFRYKGKHVSPGELSRELERDIKSAGEQLIERRVRSVRCPVHGTQAQVGTWVGGKTEATICCEALASLVQGALK